MIKMLEFQFIYILIIILYFLNMNLSFIIINSDIQDTHLRLGYLFPYFLFAG